MESKALPQQQFECASAHYYNVLKAGYLKEVEQAANKQYAQAFYKRILFEENEFIPRYTVFFHELKTVFTHFYNLNPLTATEQTLSFLPTIRQISLDALSRTLACIETEKNPIPLEKLPMRYQYLLQDDLCTLDELIQLETKTLESDEENTISLLALYHATQKLIAELSQPEQEEDQLPESDLSVNRSYTRSQQVLIFHYLLQMLGVEQRRGDTKISSSAKLLHALVGLSYNDVTDSDLYKKLSNPLGHATPKKTTVNLQVIRPIFVELDFQKIVDLIDKDIRSFSSEL